MKKIEAKYLKCLQELYLILENTSTIPLSKFTAKHSISSNFGVALQTGGIINREGVNTYTWVSPIKPNIAMARELIRRVPIDKKGGTNQISNKKPKKAVFTVKKEQIMGPKIKSTPKVENKKIIHRDRVTTSSKKTKFSILWGLISYEKN